MLELTLSVSLFNGREKSRHMFSETSQAIGAAALHGLQLSPVGINGPLEPFLLFPLKSFHCVSMGHLQYIVFNVVEAKSFQQLKSNKLQQDN